MITLPLVMFDKDGHIYVLLSNSEILHWVEPMLQEELVAIYDGSGRAYTISWEDPRSGLGGPNYLLTSEEPDVDGLRKHASWALSKVNAEIDIEALDLRDLLDILVRNR